MGNFEFEVTHHCDIEVLGPSSERNSSIISNLFFFINNKNRTNFLKICCIVFKIACASLFITVAQNWYNNVETSNFESPKVVRTRGQVRGIRTYFCYTWRPTEGLTLTSKLQTWWSEKVVRTGPKSRMSQDWIGVGLSTATSIVVIGFLNITRF